MSNDVLKLDDAFYFVPGFKRVYNQAGIDKLVKAGSTIATGICKITGAVDLLLTFKPELFGKEEVFHRRAANVCLQHLPHGDVSMYNGVVRFPMMPKIECIVKN